MWPSECFVYIVVHHVGTKIARSGDAKNGIHICTIKVDQAACFVDQVGDLYDLLIKKAQSVWVGDHEYCSLRVDFGNKIVHVDPTTRITFNGDGVEASDCSTSWVGSMCAIRDENFGAFFFFVAEVSGCN